MYIIDFNIKYLNKVGRVTLLSALITAIKQAPASMQDEYMFTLDEHLSLGYAPTGLGIASSVESEAEAAAEAQLIVDAVGVNTKVFPGMLTYKIYTE